MINKKTYIYKVFTSSDTKWDEFSWDAEVWDGTAGDEVAAIWKKEVISDPTFRTTINGSDGEMVVTLARPFDNFGENEDVKLDNTVEVVCYDREAPEGTVVFRGYIIGYIPVIENENEFVEVRVRGFGSRLSDRILRDSDGNTTITYTDVDPSTIFKDIIDKFIMNEDGELGYDLTDVDSAGVTVSYTFNTNTYREALDTVIALSPAGYYFRVEPNGKVAYKAKSNEVIHSFNVKKEVRVLRPEKNIEDFFNEVYFIGGDTGGGENLFRRSVRATSIDQYGRKVRKIVDGRTTTAATADSIASRFLDEKDTVARRTQVTVVDSNGRIGSTSGFDIESIKIGETIQVSQLTAAIPTPTRWDQFEWDSDVWNDVIQADPEDIMQITSIVYRPDEVEIEATTRIPEIAKRIEDVDRKFESTVLNSNPSAPTLAT